MVSADGFMWFLVLVSTRLISEQWNKDIVLHVKRLIT